MKKADEKKKHRNNHTQNLLIMNISTIPDLWYNSFKFFIWIAQK